MEIYYLCNQIANRIITMYERETLKLRVSESRANIFSALPSMCSFGQRLNFIKDIKKVALIFGGLNNLITLSLSLSQALAYTKRGSYTFYFTRGSPASIYGFSCFPAREVGLFFCPRRTTAAGTVTGTKKQNKF